ncbi:MAG: hypothetical protein KGD68_07550 [Candidatus Lokiarchaeota archaeon]|nr:hypothetical protein [Candidatus Lokiarchaeota archaeon]
MLKSLYILDEHGILLYSKEFIREQQYDDNILIGFFTSIANFSREALGTAVKNVNLGENNKLILSPIEDEGLLGAAIVSSNDNNELVTKIIRNIMQEFIDSYSPDYDQEKIINEEMEKIIQDVLRTKMIHSPIIRIALSWLIIAPFTILLIFASINSTLFIYMAFDLNQYFTADQMFSRFFPALILLSTGNIVILFLFPNLIFGFLSPNRNIAVVNSIIHLVVTIILFAYSSEPAFGYIVIGHLPLTMIFSLFFLFIGIRSSSKRFLKR